MRESIFELAEYDPLLSNFKIEKEIAKTENSRILLLSARGLSRKYVAKIALDESKNDQIIEERSKLEQFKNNEAVNIYHCGELDGLEYNVLEYIPMTLAKVMRDPMRDPLTVKQKIDVFKQLLQVVQKIHRSNICHMDIKPENVLVSNLDDSNFLRLCDFGFSGRASRRMENSLEDTTSSAGTIRYQSPEQRSGQPITDYTKCDIYSLGIIAYELFSGQANSGVITKLPSKFDAEVPVWVDQIITQMLSDTPILRPSCTDTLSRIEHHLREIPQTRFQRWWEQFSLGSAVWGALTFPFKAALMLLVFPSWAGWSLDQKRIKHRYDDPWGLTFVGVLLNIFLLVAAPIMVGNRMLWSSLREPPVGTIVAYESGKGYYIFNAEQIRPNQEVKHYQFIPATKGGNFALSPDRTRFVYVMGSDVVEVSLNEANPRAKTLVTSQVCTYITSIRYIDGKIIALMQLEPWLILDGQIAQYRGPTLDVSKKFVPYKQNYNNLQIDDGNFFNGVFLELDYMVGYQQLLPGRFERMVWLDE